MSNLAEQINSIIEHESYFEQELDCEIFEVDFQHRDSPDEYLNDEIDAWARHSLAASGFGDF